MAVTDKAGHVEAVVSPLSQPDLNRLRWHCRRGMLELDMVLARFLEENYPQLTVQQQQKFESLLGLEDQELWKRISGEAATESDVERMLRDGLGS